MPSKWIACAQPSADVYPETLEPRKDPDGTEVMIFRTRYQKRFAKVVEPHGIITWLKEVIE